MAVNTATTTSVAAGSKQRLSGPDVVRAVALIGVVVMNYHGYLIIRGGSTGTGLAAEFFNPWTGPLSTRFAATFVLVAGVGVTLLTKKALTSPDRITEMRWRLVRRGALLYAGGLFLDEIWRGTIIPYYGAMFAIAALLFTLKSRWVAAIGLMAILAGAYIRAWRFWQAADGKSTAWLTSPSEGSFEGYVFDVFVNGTHPLLPWLGYFCVGILLGRLLNEPLWRAGTFGIGLVLYGSAMVISSLTSTDFQQVVLSTHPDSRGLVYVASALGTALIAFATIDWIAARFSDLADPFRRAGQMTLTLYLAHILVFNFVVDWMGWVTPGGLGNSLLFAFGFWVVGIAAATVWHHHVGRGPAERIYRAIGS